MNIYIRLSYGHWDGEWELGGEYISMDLVQIVCQSISNVSSTSSMDASAFNMYKGYRYYISFVASILFIIFLNFIFITNERIERMTYHFPSVVSISANLYTLPLGLRCILSEMVRSTVLRSFIKMSKFAMAHYYYYYWSIAMRANLLPNNVRLEYSSFIAKWKLRRDRGLGHGYRCNRSNNLFFFLNEKHHIRWRCRSCWDTLSQTRSAYIHSYLHCSFGIEWSGSDSAEVNAMIIHFFSFLLSLFATRWKREREKGGGGERG